MQAHYMQGPTADGAKARQDNSWQRTVRKEQDGLIIAKYQRRY